MDLKAELLAENSNAQWKRISSFVLDHPERTDELVAYFLDEKESRLAQRASNVLNRVADQNDQLILPYLGIIVHNLQNPIHDAVKRNTIRMLQFVDIPDEYLGEVADRCFKYLDSEKEPVAVRAFSMTVLYNIVCKVPELKDELKIMIEDHLPYGSAGFKARGKEILRKLSKLKQ